jgi:two-component system phosphate regulon sensor histidine kinase PhoR
MDLAKLAALIRSDRDALLSAWRTQVRELPSAKGLDTPTLNDHMPLLIGELATALEVGSWETIPHAIQAENEQSDPTDSAKVHGLQRLQDDFNIEEVVAEYNILRGCIHDLATTQGFSLQGKLFHVVNRVFDHAIGLALKSYSTQKALEIRLRREEYLSFVAHDLQTPLVAIALAGRVLEKSFPVSPETAGAARMLKTLRRSVQHLEAVIQKVLEENSNLRSDSGLKLVRREFDLWPLTEALIEELQPIAEAAGTQVRNEVPDDLVVFADAGILKRIFQNLIGNAIKFAPGGLVIVSARESQDDGIIECWVRDNGTGMSDELLARVFEGEGGRLDSDEPCEGSGLGLSIVRTFTEAHGGKASGTSQPDLGSTLSFTLPLKAKG